MEPVSARISLSLPRLLLVLLPLLYASAFTATPHEPGPVGRKVPGARDYPDAVTVADNGSVALAAVLVTLNGEEITPMPDFKHPCRIEMLGGRS
jgi:hypothetical protein